MDVLFDVPVDVPGQTVVGTARFEIEIFWFDSGRDDSEMMALLSRSWRFSSYVCTVVVEIMAYLHRGFDILRLNFIYWMISGLAVNSAGDH